ncbi:MAG: BMP family ABC transporter substrate-binding protein [Ruminococcaceae bacterium]|nr:BMP family ABC transporter substrate-binding protein [Oscillospiraceae bacterium]
MKKFLSLALALLMVLTCVSVFASCDTEKKDGEVTLTPVAKEELKLGVILLHDEDSTYDLNFINGINAAKKALGLEDSQVIMKRNIPESNACYDAALDLIDEGCDIIFADSFGHETHMLKAAEEHPEVQFCHATGNQAHVKNLANYHNAFASIYEGRFLAGVAAGMKLNEMIEAGTITAEKAKMGYVGAFTYAEVISGYTSFYLGAKSVCPSVTMDVQFTGSWYDETAEKNTAMSLIEGGCVLISQHADSMGAPSACEEKNVPNVSYNGSTKDHCPNTFIVSSRIDWAPYIKYICEQTIKGEAIATDWCGTISTGSVVLTDVNTTAAAEGTVAKLEEVKAALVAGTTHVFDTANFTVEGKAITSHKVEEKEVIKDGYFNESDIMSAPYFDLKIDGITLLNTNFG